MIKTAGEAKQMPCVMNLKHWEGSCGAYECLAWNYFWDDWDTDSKDRPIQKRGKHGKTDMNKRGFCGFTK